MQAQSLEGGGGGVQTEGAQRARMMDVTRQQIQRRLGAQRYHYSKVSHNIFVVFFCKKLLCLFNLKWVEESSVFRVQITLLCYLIQSQIADRFYIERGKGGRERISGRRQPTRTAI